MRQDFPTQPTTELQQTPAGNPIIQFKSYELNTLSPKTAPTSDSSCKSQVVACTSDLSAINQGFLLPLSGSINLLDVAQNSKKHFTYICLFIITAITQDIGEHPDERDV